MKPSTCPSPDPIPRPSWRNRTVLKLLAIGCLVLLGLIPLALIRGVLAERRTRHHEAIANINSTWGNPQVIAGPRLVVPYQRQVRTWKDQMVNGRLERIEQTETVVARAHFLPTELSVTGDVRPDRLHRGIYEALVYRSTLEVTGHFARPSFDEWKVAPEDVLWDEAVVVVAISDLRGASEALALKWGEQSLPMVPAPPTVGVGPAVQARLAQQPFAGDVMDFGFALNLNGSQSLNFAPFGMQTRVRLTSSFPDPSFHGTFLPAQRTVTADGFEADWQVSYYGRGYPQQWSDGAGQALSGDAIAASLFGVGLVPVLDSYRYVERAIKYGILFLALVFTAFFLFEVRLLTRVHPFQYTLVGAALCLFYLAILSLSEFIPFGWAYLAGSVAATTLIACYSAWILGGVRRAWLVAAGLAGIYAFLYVLLRQQEYSLLYGTGALFLALAVVMYATRRLDWYARDAA